MKRRLAILAAVVVGVALGGVASAATGWRVFATGTDSAQYFVFASANASVIKPAGLAVRSSVDAEVSWDIYCSGKTAAKAGQIVQATVPTATKCTLNGSANSDAGGKLRVELLKR